MNTRKICIAAIQETKLDDQVLLSIPGYSIIRQDRLRNGGGGLAFIVSQDVQYYSCNLTSPPSSDDFIEQMGIKVTMGNDTIMLVNVYIPPISSCSPNYSASIRHLLDLKDCIIMGDINAHHEAWYSAFQLYLQTFAVLTSWMK